MESYHESEHNPKSGSMNDCFPPPKKYAPAPVLPLGQNSAFPSSYKRKLLGSPLTNTVLVQMNIYPFEKLRIFTVH